MPIDRSILERTPLMREEWMPTLRKMSKDQYTPRWNTQCGDRLDENTLGYVRHYARALEVERADYENNIQMRLKDLLRYLKTQSSWYSGRLEGLDIRDWPRIPLSHRRDLARHLEQIIPRDADLTGLIINPSSGTTGEALHNPSHPRAQGCYDPLLQYALKRHGVDVEYGPDTIAAVQLCYQQHTITYHTVHSYLDGAGFAKINLWPEEWRDPSHPDQYLHSLQPVFLSGDPVAFSYAMESGITYKPRALLSTALTLNPQIRKKLEDHFSCPVIDMYSLNESGPVLYSCPKHPGHYHILPHDIYVELVDHEGKSVPPGQPGFITLSGGRNPYLPLLRYRTEDTAVRLEQPCDCGETTPLFAGLEGRQTVLFRHEDGGMVNPVDISRILNRYPIVIFRCIQYNDRSCELQLFGPLCTRDMTDAILKGLSKLMGHGRIKVTPVQDYPGEKWLPFVLSEK